MDSRLFAQPVVQTNKSALSQQDEAFLQGKLIEVIWWQQCFQEEYDDLASLFAKHRRQHSFYCVSPEQRERLLWLEVRLSECQILVDVLTRMQNSQPITIAEQQWLLAMPQFERRIVENYPHVVDIQLTGQLESKTVG